MGAFGEHELWKLRVGVRAANSQLVVVGDPQEQQAAVSLGLGINCSFYNRISIPSPEF